MIDLNTAQFVFTNYNPMKTALSLIEIQIQKVKQTTADEAIYAMSMTQNMSGMPFPTTGTVSNKTANIAHTYDSKEANDISKELKLLYSIKNEISTVIKLIDAYIEGLKPMNKLIVKAKVYDRLQDCEICKKYAKELDERTERTLRNIYRKEIISFVKTLKNYEIDINLIKSAF